MQHPVFCKLLNRAAALVVGVDLNQWLRPVTATGIFLFDFDQNVWCCNLGKAARKRAVFANEAVAKVENVIHATSP
jgi:hypothetical protein